MRYKEGARIKALDTINVRNTPGYLNKPEGDVQTVLMPGDVVTVGVELELWNELIYYRVALEDGRRGWVSETSPDGTDLFTDRMGLDLTKPVPPGTILTQLWGENPEYYRQIPGYPVPLRGHNGIDWGAPVGTSILATDDGVVTQVREDPTGFGRMIMIKHSWGESLYAHLEAFAVNELQTVVKGQRIGYMGNTGASSGPHLHFGIKLNGYDRSDGWGGYSNPMKYLEERA